MIDFCLLVSHKAVHNVILLVLIALHLINVYPVFQIRKEPSMFSNFHAYAIKVIMITKYYYVPHVSLNAKHVLQQLQIVYPVMLHSLEN